MDTEAVVGKCRAMNEQGQSRDEIIELLHDSGITITDSIKIVKQTFGLSLGQAKKIVSTHPVWKGIAQAAEPLHEELAREFSPRKQRERTKTKF